MLLTMSIDQGLAYYLTWRVFDIYYFELKSKIHGLLTLKHIYPLRKNRITTNIRKLLSLRRY
jgi:hypothetical protein